VSGTKRNLNVTVGAAGSGGAGGWGQLGGIGAAGVGTGTAGGNGGNGGRGQGGAAGIALLEADAKTSGSGLVGSIDNDDPAIVSRVESDYNYGCTNSLIWVRKASPNSWGGFGAGVASVND